METEAASVQGAQAPSPGAVFSQAGQRRGPGTVTVHCGRAPGQAEFEAFGEKQVIRLHPLYLFLH